MEQKLASRRQLRFNATLEKIIDWRNLARAKSCEKERKKEKKGKKKELENGVPRVLSCFTFDFPTAITLCSRNISQS